MAEVDGRFVEASNATLLGTTRTGERVVYKPVAGVRPLWDFDATTLAHREVWTYRIAESLGLNVVPETALGDGIYGPGAVQRFIDGHADEVVITMINEASPDLWPFAVLDVVINNADRKAGHLLRDVGGKLWAIDHGLTFHVEPKLRTVLWHLAGTPLGDTAMASLRQLRDQLDRDLGDQFIAELSAEELDALIERIGELLRAATYPMPPDDRPAVPWPLY